MTKKSDEVVEIDYVNWRGERAWRRILPIAIVFASSRWHPEKQWLMHARDLEKDVQRVFALRDVRNWDRRLERDEGAEDALRRVRDYAHDITKTLTNLVGGGSEMFSGRLLRDTPMEMYSADLEHCEKRIRERFDRRASEISGLVREVRDLRRQLARALRHPPREEPCAETSARSLLQYYRKQELGDPALMQALDNLLAQMQHEHAEHARRVQDLLEANNKYLERARAAEARVASLENELSRSRRWQPIETAPRNGRWIFLGGPSGYSTTPLRVEVCRWYPEYRPRDPWQNHSNDAFSDGGAAPTCWAPLFEEIENVETTREKPALALTVYRDGSHKLWGARDASLAENEPDWLCTIPFDAERVICPEDRELIGLPPLPASSAREQG